jgi:hypothetical protein
MYLDLAHPHDVIQILVNSKFNLALKILNLDNSTAHLDNSAWFAADLQRVP